MDFLAGLMLVWVKWYLNLMVISYIVQQCAKIRKKNTILVYREAVLSASKAKINVFEKKI